MSALHARSYDVDRRLYIALRAIFSTAQQCACDFKPLGWQLYGCHTGEDVVFTEYINESYGGMRVSMESFKADDRHVVTLLTESKKDDEPQTPEAAT